MLCALPSPHWPALLSCLGSRKGSPTASVRMQDSNKKAAFEAAVGAWAALPPAPRMEAEWLAEKEVTAQVSATSAGSQKQPSMCNVFLLVRVALARSIQGASLFIFSAGAAHAQARLGAAPGGPAAAAL